MVDGVGGLRRLYEGVGELKGLVLPVKPGVEAYRNVEKVKGRGI